MDLNCAACGALNVVSGNNVGLRAVTFRCIECDNVSSAAPTLEPPSLEPDTVRAPACGPADEEAAPGCPDEWTGPSIPVEQGRRPSFHSSPTLRLPVYRPPPPRRPWRWVAAVAVALAVGLSAGAVLRAGPRGASPAEPAGAGATPRRPPAPAAGADRARSL